MDYLYLAVLGFGLVMMGWPPFVVVIMGIVFWGIARY